MIYLAKYLSCSLVHHHYSVFMHCALGREWWPASIRFAAVHVSGVAVGLATRYSQATGSRLGNKPHLSAGRHRPNQRGCL